MPFKGITIGIPKEIMPGERRVAAIPQTVRQFTAGGARVLVETGAGIGSYLDDRDYQEAGAGIATTPGEIYSNANLILKVKEPLYNGQLQVHEAEQLTEESTLICFLHPANPANHQTIRILARRRVSSFSLDGMRISRAQQMDSLTSMSTIAGHKAVILAPSTFPGLFP